MNISQYLFGGAAFITVLLIVGLMGRLMLGPTAPDRVVALDTVNTLVSCIMLLLSAVYDSVVMVDISIVYMALSYVATLYFARYIEVKGGI